MVPINLPPVDARLLAGVPVISVRQVPPAAPLRNSASAPTAWAMSAWGVTENSHAHRTDARSAAHAGDLGWLVDRAVHDLRNSLSAIRIGVELMNRNDAGRTSDASPVLAHIDSAAQRAHAVSDELADACRLASGQPLALHPQRFGLHTAVRQVFDALPGGPAGAAIEHDRLGEGACTGDPVRIGQFVALALDEIRASAPSALVIVISEVAGERFRIAVHADGAPAAGAPSVHPQVAQRAQAESRRRMLLMQAIALAHGGAMRVESERGNADRSIDASFASLPLRHADA